MNTRERTERGSTNEWILSSEAEDCAEAARNFELPRIPEAVRLPKRARNWTGMKKAEGMREVGEAVQTQQGIRKPLPPSECRGKGGAPF